MLDLIKILEEDSQYTDKDLKKYFGEDVRTIIENSLTDYNINVIGKDTPSYWLSEISNDEKYNEHSIDACYYLSKDGVIFAELTIASDFSIKDDSGDTWLELDRRREYRTKSGEDMITSQVDLPFRWKDTIDKMLTKENAKEILTLNL